MGQAVDRRALGIRYGPGCGKAEPYGLAGRCASHLDYTWEGQRRRQHAHPAEDTFGEPMTISTEEILGPAKAR